MIGPTIAYVQPGEKNDHAEMRRIRMECLHLAMAAVENGICQDPIAEAASYECFVIGGHQVLSDMVSGTETGEKMQ